MIKAHDSGEIWLVDQCQKISIDALIQQANRLNKESFIRQRFQLLNSPILISYSNTRFNGQRAWFTCPICNGRRRYLYVHPGNAAVGCRHCLKLKYRNQRYKGMIENSIAK